MRVAPAQGRRHGEGGTVGRARKGGLRSKREAGETGWRAREVTGCALRAFSGGDKRRARGWVAGGGRAGQRRWRGAHPTCTPCSARARTCSATSPTPARRHRTRSCRRTPAEWVGVGVESRGAAGCAVWRRGAARICTQILSTRRGCLNHETRWHEGVSRAHRRERAHGCDGRLRALLVVEGERYS